MKTKPILIVPGQPNSIFFEIFFKAMNKNSFLSPIILIASLKILTQQMKLFKYHSKQDQSLLLVKDLKKQLITANLS